MIFRNAHELVLDDLFLDLSGFFGSLSEVRLLLKLEGFNPAGSIKLKTAVSLVEEAERSGVLSAGGRVIESSSGNLGIALSSVCAARGYRFTCVVDPNTSDLSVKLMRAFGADVILVDRRDTNGGFLQSRIDYIHDRIKADPGLVWMNQYANPANPGAHHARTGPSITKHVTDVDFLFIGAGTTGTLMGVARYFRDHSRATRVIAVDTVGSVTFGLSARRRHIPGLGTSRRPEIFAPDLVDVVIHVEEADAIAMCRRLARERGFIAGGSTGSVLAAVTHYGAQIPPGSTVVAIGPDGGERYLNTIYDDTWVTEHFGAVPELPDPAPAVTA